MYWFKCLDMKAPVMLRITKALGKAGVVECLQVVSEAVSLGVRQLDAEMVSGWGQIRRDRAEKVLPFASELLDETWNIYQTSQKISEDLKRSQDNSEDLKRSQDNSEDLKRSQKISKDLPDNDPSNPRGSIKEEREERIEKKETHTSRASEYENYLAQSKNMNMQATGWVKGLVETCIREIREFRSDLTDDNILQCWRETCDNASASAVSSAKWYKTAFINKCRAFGKNTPPPGGKRYFGTNVPSAGISEPRQASSGLLPVSTERREGGSGLL